MWIKASCQTWVLASPSCWVFIPFHTWNFPNQMFYIMVFWVPFKTNIRNLLHYAPWNWQPEMDCWSPWIHLADLCFTLVSFKWWILMGQTSAGKLKSLLEWLADYDWQWKESWYLGANSNGYESVIFPICNNSNDWSSILYPYPKLPHAHSSPWLSMCHFADLL